jgi:hypothetical protein
MTLQEQIQTAYEQSPRSALLNMIRGFRVSQMIAVVAKLRIADHLTNGRKTVCDLARVTGSHEDSLYRLLRALASMGIFAEEDGPSFRLTPAAEFLRSDAHGSLRANAEAVGEEWMWRPWGALLHSVKTGEPACDHLYRKNTWDWFAENPEAGRLFDQCMDESTGGEAANIVAAYDFGRAGTIVDIAGGRGILVAEVLQRNPAVRGILFNLPQVIEGARNVLEPEMAGRIKFVSGNFFQTVPSGGDLYILKNILHDWNDEASLGILTICRRAMPNYARLLIIEHLVGAPNEGPAGKIGDILMMVRTGGRNRTEQEFRELLSACGFDLSRVISTPSGPDLLEASPHN